MTSSRSRRPKGLVIGDAVLDVYRQGETTLQRVGCIGNVVACLDHSAADWVVVTAHPRPDAVVANLNWRGKPSKLHIFPLETPHENVVYYDVQDDVATCVLDEPRRGLLQPAAVRAIEATLDGGFDVIAIADYSLGVMTSQVQLAIRGLVAQRQTICFADSRHADYAPYAGAYLLPTLAELALHSDLASIDVALRSLATRFSAAGILLKRGDAGLTALLDSEVFEVAARNIRSGDAAGAGDYLVGELASAAARAGLSREVVEDAVRRVESRLSHLGGGLLRRISTLGL